jgi:hypothetical protein
VTVLIIEADQSMKKNAGVVFSADGRYIKCFIRSLSPKVISNKDDYALSQEPCQLHSLGFSSADITKLFKFQNTQLGECYSLF